MSVNHKKGDHYANCLILSKEGKPLSTVSSERLDWYLKRNLAKEVNYHDKRFSRVIQLNFQHKGKKVKEHDLEVMQNHCVVCGAKEGLSTHHVVPHSVKKHYPDHKKDHTRHLCVLLCEKHHLEIEKINQKLIDNPAASFQRWSNNVTSTVKHYIDKLRPLYVKLWLWRNGGISSVNKLYIDKFMEMKPKYLPKTWLKE